VSTPASPQPVKLIMSLLTGVPHLIDEACGDLRERFGAIDFLSEALPFHYTRYYEEELGNNLIRRMVSFQKLISPDALPAIKLATNSIEHRFADDQSKRKINIDPGYLALSHLILATCKGFAHRPYLQYGVYADLTLIFQAHTFKGLEWTFPDYRSEEMIRLLNAMRDNYLNQLRSLASDAAQPETYKKQI
jgi:hypothetical protein